VGDVPAQPRPRQLGVRLPPGHRPPLPAAVRLLRRRTGHAARRPPGRDAPADRRRGRPAAARGHPLRPAPALPDPRQRWHVRAGVRPRRGGPWHHDPADPAAHATGACRVRTVPRARASRVPRPRARPRRAAAVPRAPRVRGVLQPGTAASGSRAGPPGVATGGAGAPCRSDSRAAGPGWRAPHLSARRLRSVDAFLARTAVFRHCALPRAARDRPQRGLTRGGRLRGGPPPRRRGHTPPTFYRRRPRPGRSRRLAHPPRPTPDPSGGPLRPTPLPHGPQGLPHHPRARPLPAMFASQEKNRSWSAMPAASVDATPPALYNAQQHVRTATVGDLRR
jgi:hypothetical protein